MLSIGPSPLRQRRLTKAYGASPKKAPGTVNSEATLFWAAPRTQLGMKKSASTATADTVTASRAGPDSRTWS